MIKDRLMLIYAVLLALTMWGFVITRGQAGITLEVPVSFENIPAGLTVTEGSNTSVRVSVSGHERFIRQLGPEDVKVRASLERINKGVNTHFMRNEDINLPPGLKVTGLSPSILHLRAEERATKKVPVTAAVTGLPSEGFAVRRIIVNPSTVTIEGVRKALKKVNILYTQPVDIMSAAGDVVANAKLNMSGMPVTTQEKNVTVTVTITKEKK